MVNFGEIIISTKQLESLWYQLLLVMLLTFSMLLSILLKRLLSFSSSLVSFVFSILIIISSILPRRIESNIPKGDNFCVSSCFTTITFFWQIAHNKSLFLNLNRGEEQEGHERFVRVAPLLRKSAIERISFLLSETLDKFKPSIFSRYIYYVKVR